jgi:hypothetical protein
MASNSRGFTTATEEILYQAGVWEKQVPTLDEIVSMVRQMQVRDFSGPWFDHIVRAHGELVATVDPLCGQGSVATSNIARVLRKSAADYAQRERDEEKRMRDILAVPPPNTQIMREEPRRGEIPGPRRQPRTEIPVPRPDPRRQR